MTPGVRPLIAGNWKMHGTLREATALAEAVQTGAKPGAELLVCPPFPYLVTVGGALAKGGVALGGQDCHHKASGAHTGDVSAQQLADLNSQLIVAQADAATASARYQQYQAIIEQGPDAAVGESPSTNAKRTA